MSDGQSEASVHVICGMEGEYSDREEWVVAVYCDEQEAVERVESMKAAVRVAVNQFPERYGGLAKLAIPYGAGGCDDR